MKAAISLLILGLLLLHGEALQCYKGSCTTADKCKSIQITCEKDNAQCYKLEKGGVPWVRESWGCATRINCLVMQKYSPSTKCCATDLCN